MGSSQEEQNIHIHHDKQTLGLLTSQVQVANSVGTDDSETVVAFRGRVDGTLGRDRCRCTEKEMLLTDPSVMLVADTLGKVTHMRA